MAKRTKAERIAAARKAGANIARGTKGSLLSAATGVGIFYGGKSLSKNETLSKHPYYLPLGLVAAGHFVKRKQYDIGAAMIGIGMFTGAQVYDANATAEKQKADAAKLGQLSNPAGTVPANVPGVLPANGLLNGGDTGWTSMDVPMLRDTAGVLGRQREASGLVSDRRSDYDRKRRAMALSDID